MGAATSSRVRCSVALAIRLTTRLMSMV